MLFHKFDIATVTYIPVAIIALTFSGWTIPYANAQSPSAKAPTRNSLNQVQSGALKPVAVVELFTSQGCSSCPPADALLRKIHEYAEENKLPVYVLSFHVDYWNRLGWTDPYSDPTYTQRQRAYARHFGTDRVYTPQMIVGGEREFVGSNGKQAGVALQESLQASARVKVSVEVTSRENERLGLR